MAEGTIKKLTDKGIGFINTGKAKDLFFHTSKVEGTSFEQLQEWFLVGQLFRSAP